MALINEGQRIEALIYTTKWTECSYTALWYSRVGIEK